MAQRSQNDQDVSLFKAAAKVGAITGTFGLAYGGLHATLIHSKHPAIFATTQGVELGLIGSAVWAIRSTYLSTRLPADRGLPSTLVSASAVGGALGFPLVTLFSRPNPRLIPVSAVFGGGVCYALQKGWNWYDARRSFRILADRARERGEVLIRDEKGAVVDLSKKQETLVERIGKSRWSPFSILSDEEYADMLRGKILRLDAEIAVLDDNIREMRGGVVKPVEEVATEASPSMKMEAQDQDLRDGIGLAQLLRNAHSRGREEVDLARQLRQALQAKDRENDLDHVDLARRLRDMGKKREG